VGVAVACTARTRALAYGLTERRHVATHSYMKTATAKLFQHGGSQALRLPKEFRLPGSEVQLSMTPEGILIQSLDDNRRRARLFARLEGSCPEFPEIPPPPDDKPRDPLA